MSNQIRRCLRPECRFRFPVSENINTVYCPRCGSPTRLVEIPYQGLKVIKQENPAKDLVVEALLDNIRSAFNVGSIFRAADGAGIRHLHLCGITPTPDHPRIAKTALGAEAAVGWTQYWDAIEAAKRLKKHGMRLFALEGGQDAISLFSIILKPEDPPVTLVVGNEVTGIDPGLLHLCDEKIFIPMLGVKDSLNVATAFGIAAYILRFGCQLAEQD